MVRCLFCLIVGAWIGMTIMAALVISREEDER